MGGSLVLHLPSHVLKSPMFNLQQYFLICLSEADVDV